MRGLEASITVESPGSCPVAAASTEMSEPIDTVARSTAETDGVLVEEFEADVGLDGSNGDVVEVFEDDPHSVYRFERDPAAACVCQSVEEHGCPVVDVRAENGRLDVAFRPPDVETLRDIVGALERDFDGVRLRHLMQSGETADTDPVVVDRGILTDRQREVLWTAYDLGYFAYPKGANAGEVADFLDIAPSTFREHLSAAQSKLLTGIFEET